ncbi:MAG TPA: hypothetical protein VGC88_11770 [Terriglobales bacterium]|jgi:hypothetical protein
MLLPLLLLATGAVAQEQPQLKVNYLNACRPSDTDRKELDQALQTFSSVPHFSAEFDITRGAQQAEHGLVRYVRVRREFAAPAVISSVQYSVSADAKGTTETLILKPRDSKQIVQLMIEHSVASGNPSALVAESTSADRVRLERYGTTAVVLARCADVDQSAFASEFTTASTELQRYKSAVQSSTPVQADLKWLDGGGAHALPPRTRR